MLIGFCQFDYFAILEKFGIEEIDCSWGNNTQYKLLKYKIEIQSLRHLTKRFEGVWCDLAAYVIRFPSPAKAKTVLPYYWWTKDG